MRDSAIFYRSFYESIKELSKQNQIDIYSAIFEFSFNDKKIELKGLSKSIFTLIKPQLEANNKRFENGKKGGRKRTKKEPNPNQNLTKPEPKPNQNLTKPEPNKNVNVNVNDNDNKTTKQASELLKEDTPVLVVETNFDDKHNEESEVTLEKIWR